MGILKRLFGSTDAQPSPPKPPAILLFEAILGGDLDRVVKLLEQKPDVTVKACVAWRGPEKTYAMANADERSSFRAYPDFHATWGDIREMTPPELAAAMRAAHPEKTKLFSAIKRALVTAGFPRVPLDLERDLRLAVAANDLHAAEMLLREGADVEGRLCAKESALHAAARRGFVEMAGLLLDHGANLEAQTETCSKIIEREDFKIENFLDGDPQQETVMLGGYTPLMIAVELGYGRLACVLVERGAATNVRDGIGESVQQKAARRHLEKCAGLLRSRHLEASALHEVPVRRRGPERMAWLAEEQRALLLVPTKQRQGSREPDSEEP